MAGLTHDGGFAEYMVADAEACAVLTDGVPFAQAAPLMRARGWGVVCLPEGVRAGVLCRRRAGEAFRGCGVGAGRAGCCDRGGRAGAAGDPVPQGAGHPVVAIDNREEGLKLAGEVGPEELRADAVVDFKAEDAVERVARFVGEGGKAAAAIVCTEAVDATEWGLKLLQPHEVVVLLGLPVEGFHFIAFDIVFKELTVKGSLVATKKQLVEMLAIVYEYSIRSHITTVSFEAVPRLPELYMDKLLKGRLVLKT